MAGADMSYLRDMCSKLFEEIEEDELVPGQFDSPPTKKLCTEVEKEETKVGEAAGVINPSGSTTTTTEQDLHHHPHLTSPYRSCHMPFMPIHQ